MPFFLAQTTEGSATGTAGKVLRWGSLGPTVPRQGKGEGPHQKQTLSRAPPLRLRESPPSPSLSPSGGTQQDPAKPCSPQISRTCHFDPGHPAHSRPRLPADTGCPATGPGWIIIHYDIITRWKFTIQSALPNKLATEGFQGHKGLLCL